MRQIEAKIITEAVEKLCIEANYILGDDLVEALKGALKREESPSGRDVLTQLIENAKVSKKGEYPACQDTGFTVVFLEMGQGQFCWSLLPNIWALLMLGCVLMEQAGYIYTKKQEAVADHLPTKP